MSKKTAVKGMWCVQVGRGKSSYKTRYTFGENYRNQAVLYFNALNTHSGYKKRLVRPDGTVEARVLT